MDKQRAYASIGLAGVVGDGAWRKINRGTWEARYGAGSTDNALKESITSWRPHRESEEVIVARKRSNARGAKGLHY
jgi:hypothetical protein